MKFGFRVPSLKRRIAARTSLKRFVRHSVGLKMPRGSGVITNPKRALYNKIYRKTTLGIEDIAKPTKHQKQQQQQSYLQELQSSEYKPPKKYPFLDRHFKILDNIQHFYRLRNQPGMLEKAIDACRQQIAISRAVADAFSNEYPDQPLPAHTGYEQLSIILDKQGKQHEAIELCKKAKLEGWSGSWDKKIVRYTKKIF